MSINKLFIVDDDLALLAAYQRVLGSALKVLDFEVTLFNDPLRLLEEIERSGMPTFVMTDDEMPSMLGSDMAMELRKRGFTGMILMLSGTADESVLDLGVSKLITKPASLKTVLDALVSEFTTPTLQTSA